jgi:hypothetical protein
MKVQSLDITLSEKLITISNKKHILINVTLMTILQQFLMDKQNSKQYTITDDDQRKYT